MEEISVSQSTTNHFFFGFDSPTYFPGKSVEGVLVLVIRTPINVSKIGITWSGTEFSSWFEGVNQTDHHKATNKIFENIEHTIFPSENEETKIFKEGTYSIPFSWTLPANASGSFEETAFDSDSVIPGVLSTSGIRSVGNVPSYIRYYSSAFIDFTYINKEEEPKKLRMIRDNVFRVVEPFDPKIVVQQPLVKKESINFWLGGNPLDLVISIANGGVLFSGQNLYLNLLINNKSSRSVDFVTFHLVEYLTLSVPGETEPYSFERRREIFHAVVSSSQVGAGMQFQQDLFLSIPMGTPPSLSSPKYIKRRYDLECELNVSWGTNERVIVPIQVLEWSPILRDEIPKQVPVTTKILSE